MIEETAGPQDGRDDAERADEEEPGLAPGEEAERSAKLKAEAARARLEFADEGVIRRPTRAELILAFLWAAALAPVLAAPAAGLALLAVGSKQLVLLARSISGHDAWPLMFAGTAFFLVAIAVLAPKTRERPVSAARVLVFERGRSFGPSILLLVLLVELGVCGAVLGR